ncbi:MAG: DUF547 domain-containing protein [Planctomycetota bacterium]|jgi:hypothetical protein|nr:DUF547 domain-containing protein [Planctomycetota bacterium]
MNIRKKLLVSLVCCMPFACDSADAQSSAAPTPEQAETTDAQGSSLVTGEDSGNRTSIHESYDELLRETVSLGVVNYTALAKQRPRLQKYLEELSAIDPNSLDRNAKLAFWINAYNAFTLELILEHLGRIESIKDISSSKRWKDKRWLISGRSYSLDEIEHEILRPMQEPRIHFALVCASRSCPDLQPEAFLPEDLDAQLASATRGFLANPEKGMQTRIEESFFGGKTPTLLLSRIFDWFEGDFEKNGSEVVDFVLQYAPTQEAAFINRNRADLDVEYLDYDWSLNGS